jgi:flagellar basal-body rod protein FlgB
VNITETPTMLMLTRYLDVTTFRHRLIASNMANVDTPGYRTLDVDFRSEMQRALGSEPQVHKVTGLTERPDGNNVSVDREGLLLAENQLQFRLGTQLLRGEFHRLLSAINEGR